MPFGDRAPVVDTGAAQRVGADADSGGADRMEVDNIGQVLDVGVRGSRGAARSQRLRAAAPAYALKARRAESRSLDRRSRRRIGIGGTAVWRVVLEATVTRRVVRRRDDDSVGHAVVRPRLYARMA